ncbi:hypothetical protein TNCV_404451 [Trichonephila clavipes]|nr:hypothetical protein TNCV_404451 [Trichonephila clavipes]
MPVVSFSFEHHAGDSTILLSFTKSLRENTVRVVKGPPHSFRFTNLMRGRLFRVPPSREETIHLQISMPSPGFEPRPYGTRDSFINHCTGWVPNARTKGIFTRCLRRLLTVTLQYCNPIESSKLEATAAGSIALIPTSLQCST